MMRITIISILVYWGSIGFGQSVSWTYSLGDIPTNVNGVSLGCNEIPIDITLPAGPSITVTGVDVAYDFTAVGQGFISDQRSAVQYPGQTNVQYISGVGNSSGTSNYRFFGETDANGTYPGGHVLNFVFLAFRTFGTGSPTCNTSFNKIDNNTLSITVHYDIDPEEGSVGIGTDTPDNSAILELQSSQKGFLPPRMTSALMNAIPNPEEGLMVYCSDCVPAGMYSRVGSNWTTSSGSAVTPAFILDGERVRQNAISFSDDFIFGRDDLPSSTNISDTMMFFDYSKAAFRGGRLQSSNAFGGNNVGSASFAFGENAIASGDGSTAIGSFVSATDLGAFAAGSSATASGYGSVALGEGSASGYTSFAAGSGIASGENSFAGGGSTTASGDFSVALGRGTLARSWGEIVVGSYNTDYTPSGVFNHDSSDRLFVVGRGSSSSSRNNALTILKNGHMGINTSSPASTLHVSGTATIFGSVNVRGSGFIELLNNDSFKEATAGRLSYPTPFGPVILTGGGSAISNRRVSILAKGGLGMDGGITIQNDNDLILEKSPGQTTVEILASEGTGGGQITLFNDGGTATIEIDADFGAGNVGRLTLDEIDIHGGSDIAEYFDSDEKSALLQRGTLVCIDEESEGKMKSCSEARDRKVIGVVSGANGINPGMVLGQDGSIANGDFPIALLGRVYVKTNHQNGDIQVGDFLTSSSTSGEAMRVESFQNAQGAILGKALTKRNPETGFVLVLVNLQ